MKYAIIDRISTKYLKFTPWICLVVYNFAIKPMRILDENTKLIILLFFVFITIVAFGAILNRNKDYKIISKSRIYILLFFVGISMLMSFASMYGVWPFNHI